MFLRIKHEKIVNVDHIVAIVNDSYVEGRYKVVLTAPADPIALDRFEYKELLHNLVINRLTELHSINVTEGGDECTQLQQEPMNFDTLSATETESRP